MIQRFAPGVLATVVLLAAARPLGGQAVLTLEEAVDRGLASHPALAGAAAAIDAADARQREAGSTRYPWFSFDATAVRFQESMIVAPLHDFDPTRPPTFDPTLFQGRLGARYTLFDGGARAGRQAQARAGAGGARAREHAAESETIAGIANAYLATLSGREIHTAATRRLTSLRAERNRVALLVQAGTAAEVELLRLDAALAQGEADSVRASRDLNTSARDLARQIGLPPESVIPASLTPVRTTATPETTADTFLDRARSTNPDRLAAEEEAAAARAGERVARAARFPSLTLQAGYLGFGSMAGDFTAEWQAGLGVSYPIFSGGARGSRIAEADADVALAEARLDAIDLRLAVEIDRALAQIAEAGARVAALERAVTHLTEVVRIEQLSLTTGSGVQTDFLRAEADLFTTRSSLAVAHQGLVAGHVALAAVLGTLSREWIATQLENGQ